MLKHIVIKDQKKVLNSDEICQQTKSKIMLNVGIVFTPIWKRWGKQIGFSMNVKNFHLFVIVID